MIKELHLKIKQYFRHRYVVRTDARVRGQHYKDLMAAQGGLSPADAAVSYDVFVRKS